VRLVEVGTKKCSIFNDGEGDHGEDPNSDIKRVDDKYLKTIKLTHIY